MLGVRDALRLLGAGIIRGQGCSQLGTAPSTEVFLVSRRKSLPCCDCTPQAVGEGGKGWGGNGPRGLSWQSFGSQASRSGSWCGSPGSVPKPLSGAGTVRLGLQCWAAFPLPLGISGEFCTLGRHHHPECDVPSGFSIQEACFGMCSPTLSLPTGVQGEAGQHAPAHLLGGTESLQEPADAAAGSGHRAHGAQRGWQDHVLPERPGVSGGHGGQCGQHGHRYGAGQPLQAQSPGSDAASPGSIAPSTGSGTAGCLALGSQHTESVHAGWRVRANAKVILLPSNGLHLTCSHPDLCLIGVARCGCASAAQAGGARGCSPEAGKQRGCECRCRLPIPDPTDLLF